MPSALAFTCGFGPLFIGFSAMESSALKYLWKIVLLAVGTRNCDEMPRNCRNHPVVPPATFTPLFWREKNDRSFEQLKKRIWSLNRAFGVG